MTKLFSTTCALLVLGMSSLFAAAEDAPLPDELVTAGALRQLALSAPVHPNPEEKQGSAVAPAAQAMGQSHKTDPSQPSLLDLPDEMLQRIFEFLDGDSITNISCASRVCHIIAQKTPPHIHLLPSQISLSGCPFDIGRIRHISVKISPICHSLDLSPLPWAKLTSLHSLNLRANPLREKGHRALAEALKTNRTLKSLNLGQTNLGSQNCITFLLEALEINTTLTSLNLRYNNLGAAGTRPLAQALGTNRTLKSLNLEGNSLGETGGAAIAKALEANTTLKFLDLRMNNLKGATEALLKAAIAKGIKIDI